MAGRTFVVAKEDFIMETVVFLHCDNGYNTHPTWFSLTNELKFVDLRHQINSISLVNLLLLNNKFSFICERQSCRVRISSALGHLVL